MIVEADKKQGELRMCLWCSGVEPPKDDAFKWLVANSQGMFDEVAKRNPRFPKYSYDDIVDTLADQFQGETVFGPLKISKTEEQVLKDAKRIMIRRAEDFQAIFGKQEPDQGYWKGLGAL